MERQTFIMLFLFHLVFFLVAFSVYLTGNCAGNALMADSIARAYASSIFVPNLVMLLGTYALYVFLFFKKIYRKENVQNKRLNIYYNMAFVLGVLVIMLNPFSTFFCDTIFIFSELLAVILASLIIFKAKNQGGYEEKKF